MDQNRIDELHKAGDDLAAAARQMQADDPEGWKQTLAGFTAAHQRYIDSLIAADRAARRSHGRLMALFIATLWLVGAAVLIGPFLIR